MSTVTSPAPLIFFNVLFIYFFICAFPLEFVYLRSVVGYEGRKLSSWGFVVK